jgi:uncharacterized protein YcbX
MRPSTHSPSWSEIVPHVPLTLTALHRFPIKSCGGEQLQTAVVEPWGLTGDRRWMLIDDNGESVTVREHPRLLLVRPGITPGGLDLSAPGAPDLHVPVPDQPELVPVTVFGRTPFLASLASATAHAWFSGLLGASLRLVHEDDPTRRRTGVAFTSTTTPVSFADAYPLHLTTQDSLDALNSRIAEGPRADQGPLSMVRFRPNLVVSGAQPWAEDGWRRLRIGEALFRSVKGCDRCAVAMTDPVSAMRGHEPTATLAQFRRWDGAVWFGMNLVPDNPGAVVNVGDAVEVLAAEDASDGPPR